MKTYDKRKYIFVLLLTIGIFIVAFSLSNYINNRKIADIKSTEDSISIDILSSETQFEILQQSSCSIVSGSILSDQLSNLATSIETAETAHGIDSESVKTLKKYYSLLEIKDYLLIQEIYRQCDARPISILYFYSNNKNCTECTNEGYVLTALKEEYPDLRIYSFDYDLGLNAVSTLTTLYKVGPKLPAIVVNNQTYNGFQSLDTLRNIIPDISVAAATSSTKSATNTSSTTSSKKTNSSNLEVNGISPQQKQK